MIEEKNIINADSRIDYSEKVLQVKNLEKFFYVGVGKNKIVIPAVNNVSFDIYKREVFGLVGESGCGKTTTGRTIIKLYKPTNGEVIFNGKTIGAGFNGLISDIKALKHDQKRRISETNPIANEIFNTQVQYQKEKSNLKLDKTIVMDDLKNDIKAAKEPINDYKTKVYNIKSIHTLNSNKITYEYYLQTKEVMDLTKNQYEKELKFALETEKNIYNKKVVGLKESQALSKETIKERLLAVKKEHLSAIEAIKAEYQPLIEENASKILKKEDVQDRLNNLQEEMKKELQVELDKYTQGMASLVEPETDSINKQIASLKNEASIKLSELNKKLSELTIANKAKLAALKTQLVNDMSDELKAKIAQIKKETNEQISVLKAEIARKKTINNSKESLVASRKMQMIFQDPISSLNPRMTIKEIIGEGLTIMGGYSQEEISKRVAESLNLVGLVPEFAARYPHEFSGGQRQRIGVARALIMNPNFIIADEPISALDVSIRAQVINLLTDLKETLGLTILFIAHDLSVVRFFCDRIAVMYYGNIVELATSDELFKNPMHPYTISLLSAVPQPNPDYEKGRKRIHYNPAKHNYREDKPTLREIAPGHMVSANDVEFAAMQTKYYSSNKNVPSADNNNASKTTDTTVDGIVK